MQRLAAGQVADVMVVPALSAVVVQRAPVWLGALPPHGHVRELVGQHGAELLDLAGDSRQQRLHLAGDVALDEKTAVFAYVNVAS